MDIPNVAATVASLRALRSKLQDTYDNSIYIGTNLGPSTADVLYTSGQSIDALETQGARFQQGDYSPFGDATEAWSAWSDVAQSTGDSLASSIGLNDKWTVTYFAGQVGVQAAHNLENIGLGVGSILLGLAVLFVVLEAR